jgi:ABC-type Mn2+/Zn2+ transport system permease subunit
VLVGALVIGLFMTALISVFGTNRKLPKDAVIAVIGSGLFAGGIIGVNKADTNISLNHFLFGQVLTVTSADVVITLILVLIVLAYIVSQFRDLVFSTFDPLHAMQVGIRTRRQEGVLLILIAMSVVVCISSVGIVLTVSLLISPALTSRLFSSTALQQALIGTMIAIGQVFGGFLISFHLNLPPGPTITVVGLIIFLLSFSLTSLIKDEVRVQRHRA